MVKDTSEVTDIRILRSRIAALEQLIEVYENSVVEQADKLYREIAERRCAEEEIKELLVQNRTILESAGEGLYGLDLEGKTTFANPAATKMIGYEPEELIGKLQHAILHHTRPDGTPYPREDCPIYAAFRTGTTHHVDDEVFWKKDGTSFPVEYTSTPIKKDGKVTGAVVVFKDITDRRQAEKEIRMLNEELELKVGERTSQLVEAHEELVRKEKLSVLGKLSGSVGHELRNPLGVMSNAVYFLKTVLSGADDTTKEYLDIIKKEIETSQRIIADMLDFARTKKPQVRLITVNELAKESIAKCAIPDNVALHLEIPETLPRLHIDPLQMVQVLVNIITNAVQAMPGGGGLRVSAHLIAECGLRNAELKSAFRNQKSEIDGKCVEISVTDTGEGVSPENRKKLFQPLFTTKAKGIGLGLVVCKNLVEANGGTIGVASEVGKGTTFTISLPAEEAEP
jgi:PAS domain S-box-containing protein